MRSITKAEIKTEIELLKKQRSGIKTNMDQLQKKLYAGLSDNKHRKTVADVKDLADKLDLNKGDLAYLNERLNKKQYEPEPTPEPMPKPMPKPTPEPMPIAESTVKTPITLESNDSLEFNYLEESITELAELKDKVEHWHDAPACPRPHQKIHKSFIIELDYLIKVKEAKLTLLLDRLKRNRKIIN